MNNITGNKKPRKGEQGGNLEQTICVKDYITSPIVGDVRIRTDLEGRYNLNDLHRASGTGASKAPAKFARNKKTMDLKEAIEQQTGHICTVSVEGRNGGTYAHELLAIEYAGWLSPLFQIQVNQTFIDYRTGKLQPMRQLSRKDALLMALQSEERVEQLESDIQAMAPKIKALEVIADASESFCFRDSAKMLQVRPKDLKLWLHANKWIYQQLPNANWLGYSSKTQAGCLVHKMTSYARSDGSIGTAVQCRITGKGLAKLSELMAIKE